jgi:hypothetical protein
MITVIVVTVIGMLGGFAIPMWVGPWLQEREWRR